MVMCFQRGKDMGIVVLGILTLSKFGGLLLVVVLNVIIDDILELG